MAHEKVLVLLLVRSALYAYPMHIINALRRHVPLICVGSKDAVEKLPDHFIKIKTYQNRRQFFFSLFTHLPHLLWLLHGWARRGAISTVYFPMVHYWSPIVIWWSNRLGLQTVVTIHDGIPHKGENHLWEWLYQKWSIQLAGEVIFLSRHVQSTVENLVPFKGRSHLSAHGIIYPPGIESGSRKHRSPLRLLFLGRIAPYKGVEIILKSLPLWKPEYWERLTIAGKKTYDLSVLPHHPKVDLIDKWLNEQEIAELCNSHDILLLPYTEATQSGVLTIAIAAAIPVITTGMGGLQEQINDRQALFIEPTPESLAQAVDTLATQPFLYEQMSLALVQKQGELSWDQLAQQHLLIFRGEAT